MNLPNELIKQFVKELNTKTETPKNYMYGVIQEIDDENVKWVKMDGSDELAPVVSATDAMVGDNVVVSMQDHGVIVVGNITAPASARTATNYMRFTDEGLKIGDYINSDGYETNGAATLMSGDGYYILDKDGNIAAWFKKDEIHLGERDSRITLFDENNVIERTEWGLNDPTNPYGIDYSGVGIQGRSESHIGVKEIDGVGYSRIDTYLNEEGSYETYKPSTPVTSITSSSELDYYGKPISSMYVDAQAVMLTSDSMHDGPTEVFVRPEGFYVRDEYTKNTAGDAKLHRVLSDVDLVNIEQTTRSDYTSTNIASGTWIKLFDISVDNPGVYSIIVFVAYDSNPNGRRAIRVNGDKTDAGGQSRNNTITQQAVNGAWTIMRFPIQIKAVSNGYVRTVWGYQNSGTTISASFGYSVISFDKDAIAASLLSKASNTGDYNELSNRPTIEGNILEGNITLGEGLTFNDNTITITNSSNIIHKPKNDWDVDPLFVPGAGQICIYEQYGEENGKYYSRIKIGDGNAYIVDLPFIDEKVFVELDEHVSNPTIHITEAERNFWNNKITCYMQDDSSENLILTKGE